MHELFAAIEPYDHGFLNVSGLHTIYYQQSGNPDGKPVVFLHGGPGGGIDPSYRQYFDPHKWRVVLFDQRCCGRSTPHAELRENTTWDLVSDIEKLRIHLGIESWVVFGGSWGSTLSLAYSEAHPQVCKGLILRGIFLLRQWELLWFYQQGASRIFRDAWEEFVAPIPPAERHDMIGAYYRRLTGDDAQVSSEAARAWSLWEAATSKLLPNPDLIRRFGEVKFSTAFARIECHYFVNKGFLDYEEQLLKNVEIIRHLPAVIVQGRYDIVCPMETAWELSRAWPEAEFVIVDAAGHSMSEPGIRSALIDATEAFAKL